MTVDHYNESWLENILTQYFPKELEETKEENSLEKEEKSLPCIRKTPLEEKEQK